MNKAILFDMDGTLLPMDQEKFVRAYFSELSKKLAPYGYDPKQVVEVVWKCSADMVNNDGAKTNEKVFWQAFAAIFGDKVNADKPIFDEFYQKEFHNVKASCGFNPEAGKLIKDLKNMGYTLVLASNPIFPAAAQKGRINWAGVDVNDFSYVTSYENSHFCKPNKYYYYEIAEKLGVNCEDCIMVGNDVGEDMIAKDTGMEVFLLTDCLINRVNKDISEYPNGGYNELRQFLIDN